VSDRDESPIGDGAAFARAGRHLLTARPTHFLARRRLAGTGRLRLPAFDKLRLTPWKLSAGVKIGVTLSLSKDDVRTPGLG
jgi:hypothetical protein